jgi:hypothetical protein
VTSGAITPTVELANADRKPGRTGKVTTVSFDTVGKIASGSKIKVVMPNPATVTTGWGFADDNAPAIDFDGAAGATAAWAAADRTLTLTTDTADVAAGATVTFKISDTKTPSGIVNAEDATVTTYDAADVQADGAGTATIAANTVGALTTITFATDTDSPNYKDTASASFVAAGTIPIGGKIEIQMPTPAGRQAGWGFDAQPAIAFSAPAASTTANGDEGAWDATNKVLTITTATAAIAEGATVTFSIANTVTPSGTIASEDATITTKDAASAL